MTRYELNGIGVGWMDKNWNKESNNLVSLLVVGACTYMWVEIEEKKDTEKLMDRLSWEFLCYKLICL